MKHLIENINKATANAAKHNRPIAAFIKQIKKFYKHTNEPQRTGQKST
jgi:hypothetical protein